MLQRTPTYIMSLPSRDPLADRLRSLLPAQRAYHLIRWKNVLVMTASYQLSRRAPAAMKALVRRGLLRELPPGFDLETHFTPPYDPWDQRLCVVPDGDLFAAVRAGTASIVTGVIDRFTREGVLLRSGDELPADVVVTATGLQVQVLGGALIEVDGRPIAPGGDGRLQGDDGQRGPEPGHRAGLHERLVDAQCDLVAEYVVRLLDHMQRNGYRSVTPVEPPASVPRRPFIDLRAATCSGRRPGSPDRAAGRRGGSTRTGCSTGGCTGGAGSTTRASSSAADTAAQQCSRYSGSRPDDHVTHDRGVDSVREVAVGALVERLQTRGREQVHELSPGRHQGVPGDADRAAGTQQTGPHRQRLLEQGDRAARRPPGRAGPARVLHPVRRVGDHDVDGAGPHEVRGPEGVGVQHRHPLHLARPVLRPWWPRTPPRSGARASRRSGAPARTSPCA